MNLPIKKKKIGDHSKGGKISPLGDEKLIYATAIMFVISIFFTSLIGFKTIVTLFELLKVFLSLSIISAVILMRFFKSAFPMKMMEKLVFTLIGIGPFLCAMFFSLNYLIPIENQDVLCTITKLDSRSGHIIFTTPDFPCEQFPEACVLENIKNGIPKPGEKVQIRMSKGIFGFSVIKSIDWPISESSF